jgi:hypothetical protein
VLSSPWSGRQDLNLRPLDPQSLQKRPLAQQTLTNERDLTVNITDATELLVMEVLSRQLSKNTVTFYRSRCLAVGLRGRFGTN